jgi:hypothetical protein
MISGNAAVKHRSQCLNENFVLLLGTDGNPHTVGQPERSQGPDDDAMLQQSCVQGVGR